MENKDYIIAVDLGDSNIVVAVGSAAEGGRINIDHILSRPSEGVSAGQIVNIDLAIKSIRGVLTELRETTGIDAKEVYAGISGEFIYCTSHTDHVFVPDHKNGVTQQVVDALFERMGNVLVSEDRFIMERIPQRYVINDTTEVDNPVGVFGSPLSSTFNFISSDNVPLGRLDMAYRRLNITPRRTFSNAVVVGDAVLSLDEKEEGVVVVDLGGELTDLSIYYHNVVRYISTIPIGAKAFNNDIRTLMIPERHIEPLKLKYGYALSKIAPQDLSVIIKGRTRHEQREIPVYNLAAIIEARARDIAELVGKEIADSGFSDKVPYGIVLTGGSAQLRGMAELFREVTGFEVRVAEAEDVISPQTRTKITSSADSTVVGLLLHGLKHGACAVEMVKPVAPPVVVPAPKPVPAPTPQPVPQSTPVPMPAPVTTPAPQPVVTPAPVAPKPAAAPVATPAPAPMPVAAPAPVVAPAPAPIEPENVNEVEVEPQEPKPEPIPAPQPARTAEQPKTATPQAGEPKPKGRMLKIFSSFAEGANNLVKNVNTRFDVNEDEEEV